MKTINTDDIYLKSEIYSEMINDTQARIAEFKKKYPERINENILNIDRKLSEARIGSRVYIDEEHFKEWETLIISAKAAMAKSKLFL